MQYLLVFSGSLIFVILFTPSLINILRYLKIVDQPGGRKKHTEPVPRGGGVLIFIPLILSLIIFCKNEPCIGALITASLLILLCGVWDDIKGIRWFVKYLLHSLAALVFIYYFYPTFNTISFFGFFLPYPFDIIILYFFITGVINALNMLDGLDGLVSGSALLIFMLVFMLAFISGNYLLMIISAGVTGSLIGFLKFNAFPARIFLGDTGSLIIGFFLAVASLILSDNMGRVELDLGFSIILLGLPVLDTLKVIMLRLYRKKSPFLPDRSHLHHKIQDNNIHHKTAVFLIQLFTVAFIFIAVYYVYYNRFIAAALFGYMSLAIILFNPLYRYFIQLKQRALLIIPIIYSRRFSAELLRKFLLPGSSLIIMFIVLFNFPSEMTVHPEIIGMMIAVCLLLLTAAVLSFKRYRGFNDMYVFLNVSIFFVLSGSGKPYMEYFEVAQIDSVLLVDIAAAAILFFVGIFILFREKIFGNKVSLFSGLDLSMMVLVVFLISLQELVNIPAFEFIGFNLVTAFIIYMWYKIVMLMVPAVSRRIYVIAFILPVAMLLNIAF